MTNDSIQQRTTRPRNDYRDLCIEEAVAHIADFEHDYVLVRDMLSSALTIAEQAQRNAARERQQGLALAAEFREFRRRTMAGSVRSHRPTRRASAHLLLDSDRPTERPHA